MEPQEAADVEGMLFDYVVMCHALVCPTLTKILVHQADVWKKPPTDALLFAVIGGKLSEGLNFSDDLAHAVITINLPFVNLRSLELQEHMKYVNRLKMKFNLQRKPGQKDAASNLYENMCMNAINQTSKYW